jgi:hypothetical protein
LIQRCTFAIMLRATYDPPMRMSRAIGFAEG